MLHKKQLPTKYERLVLLILLHEQAHFFFLCQILERFSCEKKEIDLVSSEIYSHISDSVVR